MKRKSESIVNLLKGKNVLPINVLLEGKKGLVVGAGHIALRKVNGLIVAGAETSVVAPEASAEIRKLADEGRIVWHKRAFTKKDVSGKFIVYAATNKRDLNCSVLDSCRERGILCNIVDKGWHLGDFIAPASFSWNGLTISISSGGRSCRQSRMIKEQIKRYLESIGNANLLSVGTDHRHLTVNERENFNISLSEMNRMAGRLKQFSGVFEFYFLSTCNRFELLAVTNQDQVLEDAIIELFGFNRLSRDKFYLHRGFEAFRHMAYVFSGLNSQALGESQIVSQGKDAIELAVKSGWASSILQNCFDKSLNLSKKIRNHSKLLLDKNSIEQICLEYLKEKHGSLDGKKILVVGSGALGKKLIGLFNAEGASLIVCYHQNIPEPARHPVDGLEFYPISEIEKLIPMQDIIISALRSPKHVITKEHVKKLKIRRSGITILDLSMPLSVEPGLSSYDKNINLINLDGLKDWSPKKRKNMAEIFNVADKVISDAKDIYGQIENSFKVRDTDKQTL